MKIYKFIATVIVIVVLVLINTYNGLDGLYIAIAAFVLGCFYTALMLRGK